MAIFLNFVVKTTLIWLVFGGFFCVSSQSETICNLHSCYKFCTRVTEELHSFLSQSELSNFFVYIINALIFELLSIRKYKTENQINIYLMSIIIGQKSTNQIAQYMSES